MPTSPSGSRMGRPLRRSGWNKATGWPHVVAHMGLTGLRFHDLRHTGDGLAADMGVSTKNVMARMGHDNERAALIYQHKSAATDRKIADGLDRLIPGSDDDGAAGTPGAGGLMARQGAKA
jgi:integrase